MPYNPGVVDRSGEYMAQGISQLGGTLGQVIQLLGQQRDQAEELRTQMGGPAGQSGTEMNPGQMDLSMFGVPEGPGEGTGEGGATQEDKVASAAKVAKALRTLGEHGYGYDRNMLETMGLPELRGLARRSEMEEMRKEQQTNQQLKLAEVQRVLGQVAAQDDASKQRKALGQFWNQLNGARPSRASVTGRVGMDGERIAGADGQPGGPVSMAQVLQALDSSGYSPKPEEVDGFVKVLQGMGGTGPAQIDQVDLPFGHKGVVVRGSKDLKVLTDLSEEPVEVRPGVFRDARGNLRQFKEKTSADGSLLPVLDPLTKEPLKGFGMDATGKVHDFRSEVEKKVGELGGKAVAPKTPAALEQGPARPMTQGEFEALPKGAMYINPKDGKLYRKK